MDGGQRRVDVRREVDVVEAHDADVAGDREALGRAAPRIAPIAIASLIARTAVGRCPPCPRPREGSGSALDRGRPTTTRSSGTQHAPTAANAIAIAAQPSGGHVAPGSIGSDGAGGLDPDDQDVAMAELEQVLGGGARAAVVVDVDRAVLGQAPSNRRARSACRRARICSDLGVVARQADRDDAVDRRPAHGTARASRATAR